ncbi:putative Ulp1 protease family catalytic domain, papain-like cysteine peptidase superfamily [Helianthus annuus]|uniref:Ulp1 protease family catalytic domain, papain-like cysteine peptidase superfamily n=1 Tax=Helianthus annuus TaxID=4232 RepID=A0A9K3E0I0_HELAN|nr:putative Ulp1 protease family catalytic domain, papain-like cysteine peptidase superfamily [Helianthus annuus]KAJ0455016.1 putative Ulp1 protease family catalytic domain, papain-like cysteine peptidase superfamily [Helianthus annuus]KAJ0830745.1 putative Ulp1 protease family catalytic domain, papain-like cysteine peptidase superfamily [Helianthus annuus]
MGTRVVFEWMLMDQQMQNEKRMDRFRKNMRAGVYGNQKLFDLRSFDMVLFPVLVAGHFYLLAFELKNPAITLIDNGAENYTRRVLDSDSYINKSVPYKYASMKCLYLECALVEYYLTVIDVICKQKEMFVHYLEEVNHSKAAVIKSLEIKQRKLEWATNGNRTDCGVFLMRHMEKYMGSHVPFDVGFSLNGSRKMKEVRHLRMKYGSHILLSPSNTLKGKIQGAMSRA